MKYTRLKQLENIFFWDLAEFSNSDLLHWMEKKLLSKNTSKSSIWFEDQSDMINKTYNNDRFKHG